MNLVKLLSLLIWSNSPCHHNILRVFVSIHISPALSQYDFIYTILKDVPCIVTSCNMHLESHYEVLKYHLYNNRDKLILFVSCAKSLLAFCFLHYWISMIFSWHHCQCITAVWDAINFQTHNCYIDWYLYEPNLTPTHPNGTLLTKVPIIIDNYFHYHRQLTNSIDLWVSCSYSLSNASVAFLSLFVICNRSYL